jgi:uncharacterized protein (DUF1015 family)
MASFRPFRALHYDPARAGGLEAVIAPPYDVIDDAARDRLYERSPHNVIRLILNRAADRYGAAAADLAEWRRERVLVHDAVPCLYYYVQEFPLADGSRRRRSGLIAAVRLAPFSEGVILPHERTFARAKEDRLRLVRSCRTNLSPLFGLYANRSAALDPARQRSESEPAWIDVTDEGGDRHRVWRIAAAEDVERIQQVLADATVFIADGHHRYETALAYRDERRTAGDTDPEAPHNFVLMYLTSMDDPGLVVLPTHRLWRGPLPGGADEIVSRLAAELDVRELDGSEAGQPRLLEALNAADAVGSIAMRIAGREPSYLLRLRDPARLAGAFPDLAPVVRALDVSILDGLVLRRLLGIDCTRAAQEGQLAHTHDDREALAATRHGASLAFLLPRPRMRDIEAVCLSGQVMPEKSTYFYPKLKSGLVFHLLDN